MPVYSEMLRQVCRDYPGLPDPRSLTLSEVRWFYEGLRLELRSATAPQPTQRTPAPKAPRRARRGR